MKRSIFILALLGIVALFFTFTKYKSSTSSVEEINTVFITTNEVRETDVLVRIKPDFFSPATTTVKVGDQVVFLNETPNYSWPASDPHPTHTNSPKFDPELPMKQGEGWVYTFSEEGSFLYHDHLDPSKRGVINVTR